VPSSEQQLTVNDCESIQTMILIELKLMSEHKMMTMKENEAQCY